MTRKDYKAMSEDIRQAWQKWSDTGEQDIAQRVLRAFVDEFEMYLEEDNPRFDSVKFREACGL